MFASFHSNGKKQTLYHYLKKVRETSQRTIYRQCFTCFQQSCVSVFISNAVRVMSTVLCLCIYQQCCTCVVNSAVYLYLSAMLCVCCQQCCVSVFISNCWTCVVNVVVYSTLSYVLSCLQTRSKPAVGQANGDITVWLQEVNTCDFSLC